jgi:hypothetical protein
VGLRNFQRAGNFQRPWALGVSNPSIQACREDIYAAAEPNSDRYHHPIPSGLLCTEYGYLEVRRKIGRYGLVHCHSHCLHHTQKTVCSTFDYTQNPVIQLPSPSPFLLHLPCHIFFRLPTIRRSLFVARMYTPPPSHCELFYILPLPFPHSIPYP